MTELKKNTPQTKTPVLCYEGWAMKDGNSSGRCCCNCRYQKYIVGHPWNKNSWSKGSITQAIGYGCLAPEMRSVIFFDNQHGMCEMHDWRELYAESKPEHP